VEELKGVNFRGQAGHAASSSASISDDGGERIHPVAELARGCELQPETTDAGESKSSKCFGFGQTYDDRPKRRLFELLKWQGMQENQHHGWLQSDKEFLSQQQEEKHSRCLRGRDVPPVPQ
jgi:hypothetical protein